MTIMTAKYDSPCHVAYADESGEPLHNKQGQRIGPGELELCEGIKAGDEIIYQVIGVDHATKFNRQTTFTSVGHLACRAAEHERVVIDKVIPHIFPEKQEWARAALKAEWLEDQKRRHRGSHPFRGG